MAEDRTPRIVALTQPLGDEPPRTHDRPRASDRAPGNRRTEPEDGSGTPPDRSSDPDTGPDDIHPPALA